MELRRLRYFVVLASELHYGRAADRLQIAQPALSQQIKILERELDTRLFDRTRRRVELTPAGQVLLEHATDLLQRADRAAELTQLTGRGLRGRLRLAFTRSAPAGVSAEIVDAFRARHPGIELDLTVASTGANIKQLLDGQVDAAFVRPPLSDSRLDCLTVAVEPLAVALPAGHPLAQCRAIRPAELRGEPVVSWPRANGPGLHDTLYAQVWGQQPPRMVREEPDEDHMLRAVADGTGIAVCMQAKLTSLRVPGVVVRPFRSPAPTVELGLARRIDNTSDALGHLLAIASQYALADRAVPSPDNPRISTE